LLRWGSETKIQKNSKAAVSSLVFYERM